MNKWLKPGVFVFFFGISFSALAEDPRQYCHDMYPPESYEPEERTQYLEECLALYADEAQTEESTTYYEGTVEDYVEEVAPEEQYTSEQAE